MRECCREIRALLARQMVFSGVRPIVAGDLVVCKGPNTLKGLDISHYDGTINWTSVAGASAGYRFAITKAS